MDNDHHWRDKQARVDIIYGAIIIVLGKKPEGHIETSRPKDKVENCAICESWSRQWLQFGKRFYIIV